MIRNTLLDSFWAVVGGGVQKVGHVGQQTHRESRVGRSAVRGADSSVSFSRPSIRTHHGIKKTKQTTRCRSY